MKTTHIIMASVTVGVLFGSLGLTGCKSESINRTAAEEQSDQELAEQVKTAFGNSPSFKFPDVRVTSFKGKVQLSGFVRSEDQKQAAETIAKGISDVAEVENSISLKQ